MIIIIQLILLFTICGRNLLFLNLYFILIRRKKNLCEKLQESFFISLFSDKQKKLLICIYITLMNCRRNLLILSQGINPNFLKTKQNFVFYLKKYIQRNIMKGKYTNVSI